MLIENLLCHKLKCISSNLYWFYISVRMPDYTISTCRSPWNTQNIEKRLGVWREGSAVKKLAILEEDLPSFPSTYVLVHHLSVTPISVVWCHPLFCGHCLCVVYIYTYVHAGKTHSHGIKISLPENKCKIIIKHKGKKCLECKFY